MACDFSCRCPRCGYKSALTNSLVLAPKKRENKNFLKQTLSKFSHLLKGERKSFSWMLSSLQKVRVRSHRHGYCSFTRTWIHKPRSWAFACTRATSVGGPIAYVSTNRRANTLQARCRPNCYWRRLWRWRRLVGVVASRCLLTWATADLRLKKWEKNVFED